MRNGRRPIVFRVGDFGALRKGGAPAIFFPGKFPPISDTMFGRTDSDIKGPGIPKPMVFKMKSRTLGILRARAFITPPAIKLSINGITKDKNGTVIGSATVKLYMTATDVMLETVVSDASTGVFSFGSATLGQAYYVVAYKAGAPDLAGTTLNTLNGAILPADTSVYLRDPTTADSGGAGAFRPIGSAVVRRLQ